MRREWRSYWCLYSSQSWLHCVLHCVHCVLHCVQYVALCSLCCIVFYTDILCLSLCSRAASGGGVNILVARDEHRTLNKQNPRRWWWEKDANMVMIIHQYDFLESQSQHKCILILLATLKAGVSVLSPYAPSLTFSFLRENKRGSIGRNWVPMANCIWCFRQIETLVDSIYNLQCSFQLSLLLHLR